MRTDKRAASEQGKVGAVVVVGGGIGGMQASLDLANAGYKVYLVEGSTAIGGRMAQLDKTFPTNDCALCTISPRLIEVDKHRNIDVITNAEVESVAGEAGNFKVRVRVRPRFVDLEKCNACGDCLEVCPVAVPSEFEEGLGDRRAVFKAYPQAVPSAVAISKLGRPPCVLACPAHVNCQGYVALVAAGKFAEALKTIRERNPFPSVCGRICHHPCEAACYRGDVDEPVAINPLKRFVADYARAHPAAGGGGVADAAISVDPKNPKVAIVGAGPAGLTAARDLTFLGYPVTVFEALPLPGGMLRWGVPRYRLPADALQHDIDEILRLGIELKTGCRIGEDLSLADLRRDGYRAIFLAIGAWKGRDLAVEGTSLAGVVQGIDFLRQVNARKRVKVPSRIVVIGGGNVAIDVAMTALRVGAREVTLACLEKRGEMPAHAWEVADALAEGVTLRTSWGPGRIIGTKGRARGVELVRCLSVFDKEGRFNPTFDETVTSRIEADMVVVAIGLQSDLSGLEGVTGMGGAIQADPLTLETGQAGVFAGGDAVSGPRSVVEAIAQGHEGAVSIDRHLRGEDLLAGRAIKEAEPAPTPRLPVEKRGRVKEPALPIARRLKSFKEITRTLSEDQAIAEAGRCLNCGLCSECLLCVDACPAQAIDHRMAAAEVEIDAGAIILAPGYEPFDPRLKGEYGYGRFANVVTAMEFERILSASGPYQGQVRRPSDGKGPRRVAWVQCVGSRDATVGRDYCSSVCCMYATKEAVMAMEHAPGLKATIFYNDIRAHGKGFEQYYESAKNNAGVRYVQGIISSVKENQKTRNLRVRYFSDNGRDGGHIEEREFGMVVLSTGLVPAPGGRELARRLGVELDRFGFASSTGAAPNRTNRPGIYVAGSFEAPMDIPETVMGGGSAAALAMADLAGVRGEMAVEKEYPPERDVGQEEPRVGVFVCRCGSNIARVVDVPSVTEYSATLPNVVYAEENIYTCSTDTQQRIVNAIREHGVNRVVVASCTPRTHEGVFQDTLREAGLNKYLFEMANIRDQCSWAHAAHPAEATEKAKALVRMAAARAALLEPLGEVAVEVVQRGLVIGGGLAGITAALSLASQGFACDLVEQEGELGGNLRRLRATIDGLDVREYLRGLLDRLAAEPRVTVYTGARVTGFAGHVGRFSTTIARNGEEIALGHGALIVATGAAEYRPAEYGYGESGRILTQLELEERMAAGAIPIQQAAGVVMIQCVGSREEGHPYCSRVCCTAAIKNALRLKEINPGIDVTVLFRDMRTYGLYETYYRTAREQGVRFIRWTPERRPRVTARKRGVKVVVYDDTLKRKVLLRPDYLVLSAGVRPREAAAGLAARMKLPLTADGFFLEAHMKLRPLDCATEGVFLCGLAHAPKMIPEAIAQAQGAAARAATILARERLQVGGVVARVDEEQCAACLACVRACPYEVPVIHQDGYAFIDPARCHGCGICAAECPQQAIGLQHYRDEQVIAKVAALAQRRR